MTSTTNENKWRNIGSRTRTSNYENISIPEQTIKILKPINNFGSENKVILITSTLESSAGITNRGTLTINDYLQKEDGILSISGGIVNNISNLSFQISNGIDICGSFYQTIPDISNQTYLDSLLKTRKGNVFRSITNVFDTSLNTQNSIVGISGNLFVTEFSQRNEASNNYLNSTIETSLRNNNPLLINSLPYFLEDSFIIYDSSVSEFSGNIIEVYNYGKMKRDFTNIDDLVSAISLLIALIPLQPSNRKLTIEFDSISSTAPYRIINIGNQKKVSNLCRGKIS